MEKAKELVAALHQQALKNQHCDVKIIAHGKVYGAHRGVLVQASTYFKKLFSGSFRESHSGELSFTEIVEDTDMFEAILEYIYLGSLDFEVHAPEDVLQVASLLLLDDLVLSCRQMLLERLTLDNVLHTWSWAHLYNLKPLEEVCKALCRTRFHDTIIHQPDTMRLPVDFLCHIIKEGVLGFVDESAKLTFLQTWLHQYTRKRLMTSKGVMERISNEIKDVETNLAAALNEHDFLSKQFQIADTAAENVDCLISVNETKSNTKTLSICDLKTGKWYESAAIAPPNGFPKCYAMAERFIVFQNYAKDKLYAFDNVTKKGVEIFIPTYSFKGSDHMFKLGGMVYLLVAMSDWAVPSMEDSARGTNSPDTVRREGNGEGCSSHHKGPTSSEGHTERESQPGTSVDTCEHSKPNEIKPIETSEPDEGFELPLLDLEDMESFNEFDSMLQDLEENPIDLTLQNNRRIKHCLFQLHTVCSCEADADLVSVCPNCFLHRNECLCDGSPAESDDPPPSSCQKCRPHWKLVCEVPGVGPRVMLNKYKSKKIGGRFWIMAYGTTKDSHNTESSEEGGEGEEEKGPFWFCVETLNNSQSGARVYKLTDPPEKRTRRSRGVDWSKIKLVDIMGCFGLRSFKSPVRYSIYFDASDWRWKWTSYKTEFDVDKDSTKRDFPAFIKLEIREKKDSNYHTTGWRWCGGKHRYDYASSCEYSLINQIWSYETEEEGGKELHPPPWHLWYSSWNRTTVSNALLRSLDPIKPRLTFDFRESEYEYDKMPYSGYEFVTEKS